MFNIKGVTSIIFYSEDIIKKYLLVKLNKTKLEINKTIRFLD
ncbi:hypothetical protein CBF_3222 [Clostridium botulinum F str. 230613]|uniref:Uncharacterized protein n=1 Tax=Clostridium botulinum (strain Langeland / NCTC 10281 / Type F) TaxID=441772 RepID=A7GI34_CLOBL|nr:hypothetical protein CLI_3232 [Clostridium botulinum F str. Langeland]ADG00809.1 hypothetical protein CBF_3222 [Clostridium botulinum F str. 230613]